MSPRSTTRPWYFWCFASNSAFFRWHMSISEAKWTFAPFVLASAITSFLLRTFVPFFIHCCFCCGYLHGLRHGNKFVYQIIMLQWIVPFPAIWSSWWFGGDSSIRSRGFTGFHDTRKICFDFGGCTTPTILIALHNFAFHGIWPPLIIQIQIAIKARSTIPFVSER